ncbi:uncharacterized protein LOC107643193 [Arachis ipaensis]|uniref:uncharacterized protein LOC107643193 n=1 Tax=Arachis ipaensis TaxID=130454 RepID=UPI000A2B7FF4|nr:uncharacterized protein LOC107643193 [Arachis ipaensis]XP_020978921.1 uncharacterized protein LOC107643193 [Arachis ipaensis]
MLRLIVDLVEATIFADNSEWRLLLVAKDTQLIDSIAEKQSQIFSEKCQKFLSSRQNFLKSKKFVESSTKALIVLNRDLGIFSAFKFSVSKQLLIGIRNMFRFIWCWICFRD